MTFTAENIFFLGAVLIFASIVISKWGYRFGVPPLLLLAIQGTTITAAAHKLDLATEEPKTGNDFVCGRERNVTIT